MFTSYLSVVFIFIDLNFEVKQIFCGNCNSPTRCVCDENPRNISNGTFTTDYTTANYTCDVGFHLEHVNSTIYCVKLPPNNITWDYTNLPLCIRNASSSSSSTTSTAKSSETASSSPSSQVVTTSIQTNRTSTTTAVPGTTLSNNKENGNTVVYVAVPLVVVICILIGLLILGWRRHRIKSGHEKVKFHNEAGTGAIVSITNNSYGGGNIISTAPTTDGNIAGSEYAEISIAEGPGNRGQDDQANEYQMIDDVVDESKAMSIRSSSYSHSGQKQLASSRNAYSHLNSELKINSINADCAKVENKQENVVDDLPTKSPENSYDKVGKTASSKEHEDVKLEPDLTEPASDYSHLRSGETTAGKQSLPDQAGEYSHLNYRQSMAKSDLTETSTAKKTPAKSEPNSNLKQNGANPTTDGYETPVGVRHNYLELQPTWRNADEVSKGTNGTESIMPSQQTCDRFQYQCAKDTGSATDEHRILKESELEKTEIKESHDYFVLEKTF